MAKFSKLVTAVCVVSTLGIGVAYAQDVDKAVKARKSVMQLYAHYLGKLGGMAKGNVEYNSEAASAAANSLAMLAKLDQSAMWPQGSDTDALGEATAALPAIWTTFPAITEKGAAFGAAADKMAAAAGTDLASLQAVMGELGGACGACHKDFRLKRD